MSDAPVTQTAADDSSVQLNYATPARERLRWLRTLGWAVYLAASWTWCIGMFLPVLLVRDYGVWGWIVFAVPNVIGAAAMGWVIKTPEHSRALTAAHAPALTAFSVITAAFQVFFAMWIFRWLGDDAENFTRATLAVALLLVCVPITARPGLAPIIAAAFYAISLICIAGAYWTGQLVFPHMMASDLKEMPGLDVAWIAPVCVFGFLLCPYLDWTFHHARQQLTQPRESRGAFGIGFGVLFFGMIFFTLTYAVVMIMTQSFNMVMGDAIARWLSVHLAAQLAFTIGVHWITADATDRRSTVSRLLPIALASVVIGFIAYLATRWIRHPDYDPGEVVYRCFMAFYGLVFPAYVWLCMLPSWREPSRPSRRSLVVFASALVIAAPMYYLGFIAGKMIWLVPGLLVVLLARLACTGSNSPRDRSPSRSPA